jgi:DNA-binding CsgD family transcriptional regulator
MNGFDWDGCIDRLYDAVGYEEQLARALSNFMPLVDAQGVTFGTTPDERTRTALTFGVQGLTTVAQVEYVSHFAAYDEWGKAAFRRNLMFQGAQLRGSELVPQAELEKTYFWKQWMARYGIGDILACVVETVTPDSPAFFLTFFRLHGKPPFSDADKPKLAALTPHLRRVLRLHRRLAPQLAIGATLQDLFRAAEVPMLFLADDGSIVDRNLAASTELKSPERLLQIRSKRLQVRSPMGWRDITTDVHKLNESGEPSFEMELRDEEGRSARLEVRKVHGSPDGLAVRPAAVVCTLKPLPLRNAQVLKDQYRLTSMEYKVLRSIVAGSSALEISKALKLGLPTIRTHIRNLMAKIGVTRQVKLVSQFRAYDFL